MRHLRTTVTALLITLPACAVEDQPMPEDLAEDSDGAEQEANVGDTHALPGGFDADIGPQGIFGGVSWNSSRDVIVFNFTLPDTPWCSGTLLRNDVVLTARHCVNVGGEEGLEEEIGQPNQFVVAQDGPGDTYENAALAESIVVSPEHDVALIRLPENFTIAGRETGASTEIWPEPDSLLVGQTPLCLGFGYQECGIEPEGFLHAGLVMVNNIYSEAGFSTVVRYRAATEYNWQWLQAPRDSGSSCRFPLNAGENQQRVLGVLSYSDFDTCGGNPENPVPFDPNWRANEIAPSEYRAWALDEMDVMAGDFFDGFSSSGAYEAVSPPTTGYAPVWFNYNGELWQFYDGYEKNDTTEEGTKYIASEEVLNDASIRVDVRTNDHDPVGLVARVRDDTHYYRLSFDESDGPGDPGVVQIHRRDGNSFELLASGPFTGTFSASTPHQIEFRVTGNVLRAFFDGTEILSETDADYTYMTGRAGLYTYKVSGTRFDDFEIDR